MHELERLYITGENEQEIELVVVKRLEANDKKYIIFYAENDPTVGKDLQAATLVPTTTGTEAFGEIETQEEMDFINEVVNGLIESGEFVPAEAHTHDEHHNHEHLYAEDENGNEIVFAVERRLEINGTHYIVYYDESDVNRQLEVAEIVETENGQEVFPLDTEAQWTSVEDIIHALENSVE